MPKQFRQKSNLIEADQFLGTPECLKIPGVCTDPTHSSFPHVHVDGDSVVRLIYGDWIITHPDQRLEVCCNDWFQLHYELVYAPEPPKQRLDSPLGYCPECGARGATREKRPNGNDTCENGHQYPSSSADMNPPGRPFKAAQTEQPPAARPPDPVPAEISISSYSTSDLQRQAELLKSCGWVAAGIVVQQGIMCTQFMQRRKAMSTEATVTINGRLLSEAEVTTMRVALNMYMLDMNQENPLGSDTTGQSIAGYYRRHLTSLIRMLME